jgi:hypothetical protein
MTRPTSKSDGYLMGVAMFARVCVVPDSQNCTAPGKSALFGWGLSTVNGAGCSSYASSLLDHLAPESSLAHSGYRGRSGRAYPVPVLRLSCPSGPYEVPCPLLQS